MVTWFLLIIQSKQIISGSPPIEKVVDLTISFDLFILFAHENCQASRKGFLS